MIGQFYGTMIVASSKKEWLKRPIKIYVLETIFSHLNFLSLLFFSKQLLLSTWCGFVFILLILTEW